MSNQIEKRDNIEIIRGHNTASYFWIMPVKTAIDNKTGELECERFTSYEISIEEDDVLDYLAYFLFKHFDGDLPENKSREFVEGFDWNLEHNFYTYETVRKMQFDIARFLEILCSETDEASIREQLAKEYPAKASMGYVGIDMARKVFDGQYTFAAVIRFYMEYTCLIDQMLSDCKECHLISFMGP